ncbi:hypothetical protein OS121_19410 [Mycolicibacterium mucogenicum]|uniref:hypothetical protein n=1 Tax=Mycolicibacterium mucogenicum TaxID=56689 RepID=UPI002269DDDF|nr:hypothetical protein [Mycolicibacterium mucogenicum]MCX8557223.1 hypothetical protein [Mycolicibacterium mucogenicum]
MTGPFAQDLQVCTTLFVGRSHTEIARLIAKDHDWQLLGDAIVEPDGTVVAASLEELARKALILDWFHPSGAHINWHHFGGAKETNADLIRRIG